jgi:hypothetical protein
MAAPVEAGTLRLQGVKRIFQFLYVLKFKFSHVNIEVIHYKPEGRGFDSR